MTTTLAKNINSLYRQLLRIAVFSLIMFWGYLLSSFLEAIPEQASWFLPAGIRFWYLLLTPRKYWFQLFLAEVVLFNFAVSVWVKGQSPTDIGYFIENCLREHWYLPMLLNMIFISAWGNKLIVLDSAKTATRLIGLIGGVAFSMAFLRVIIDQFFFGYEVNINAKVFVGFLIGDSIGIMLVSILVYGWRQRKSMLQGESIYVVLKYLACGMLFMVCTSMLLAHLLGTNEQYFIELTSFAILCLFVFRFRLLGSFMSLFIVYTSILITSGLSGNSDFWDMQVFISGISVTALLLGAAIHELSNKNHDLEVAIQDLEYSNREKQTSLETSIALASKLSNSQENERQWISRELHDDIGQAITALKTDIKLAEIEKLDKKIVDSLRSHCDHIYKSVYHMLHRLRPKALEELGLAGVLGGNYFKDLLQKNNIKYFANVVHTVDLNYENTLMLYRIVQEAINNVIKHSHATACNLSLSATNKNIYLNIQDNGHGFDVKDKSLVGNGLSTIKERVLSMNGELNIHTDKDGTMVEVTLPVDCTSL